MIRYVCGFLYAGGQVYLIQKRKPKWMAGKWNGIGGKVEPGENIQQAMHREFVEETGLIGGITWQHFATLNGIEVGAREGNGTPYQVYFFRGMAEDKLTYKEEEHKDRAEITSWWSLDAFPSPEVMLNLNWLIPMAQHLPGYDSPLWIEEWEFQKRFNKTYEDIKCPQESIEPLVLV